MLIQKLIVFVFALNIIVLSTHTMQKPGGYKPNIHTTLCRWYQREATQPLSLKDYCAIALSMKDVSQNKLPTELLGHVTKIKKGSIISSYYEEALLFAIQKNDTKYLSETIARIPQECLSFYVGDGHANTTLLMKAAGLGHKECLKLLLDQNLCEVDFKVSRCTYLDVWIRTGATALMFASLGGHIHCMEMLLEHGANPNLKNDRGYTALHYAAECGEQESIKILLEKGALANEKNNAGETPFDIALEKGHHWCCTLLDPSYKSIPEKASEWLEKNALTIAGYALDLGSYL